MITTFRVANDPDIIAYSKIVIREGNKPCRVVLRKLEENKWVTHLETLGIDGTEQEDGYKVAVLRHDGFHQGNYFHAGWGPKEPGEVYAEAVEDFKSRAERL